MIGIPRSLFYYYDGEIWNYFFDYLNIPYMVSPKTNKKIIEMGKNIANDEMCMSVKNYLGHVAYLKDKCEYILVPRIANYKDNNQTCTNFLAMYDIVNNLFDNEILNYNIDLNNHETLKKGLKNIALKFNKNKKQISQALDFAFNEYKTNRKKKILHNILSLKEERKKVLIISHPYNTYDEFIGKPIIKLLNDLDVQVIYSDLFNKNKSNILSKKLSKDLYWKYSKEIIGSIELVKNKIDGIIFLSTFPCGLDSLVNELIIRKVNMPYLNLIIDDLDSLSGFETRIESFVDILNQK